MRRVRCSPRSCTPHTAHLDVILIGHSNVLKDARNQAIFSLLAKDFSCRRGQQVQMGVADRSWCTPRLRGNAGHHLHPTLSLHVCQKARA